MRWLLHAGAVAMFVLAALVGTEEIAGYVVDELDWVTGGLALWATSSLPLPKFPR